MSLPQKLTLAALQTQWAQQLNPVISNVLINGQLLKSIPLVIGTNVINHGLQRNLQGWFLVSPRGSAVVYQAAQQPNGTLSLTVVASAAITTDMWVF